jgi:2-oxoisovalerate dehydrogenase E1 component alpha subunit
MIGRRIAGGLQRICRGYTKGMKPFNEKEYVYTGKLSFLPMDKTIETFRVIDLEGNVIAKEYDNVDTKLLTKIYEYMVRVEIIDDILLKSQRQGKISFYMTSFGENATVLGVSAALKDHDMIYGQYREQASFVWRGFTIDEMIAQCAGNKNDPASGRQMPIHYTAKRLNQQCISSPLATQIPHAAGAGYSFRIANEDRIAVTFFGEGTTSEGDFHAGMNFGATLNCQTLFICRNNKYAISTSSGKSRIYPRGAIQD